ncbi:hypothetical protein N7486_004311 [Penicillium sp. IBT 16267x]|nr:hypothetical protein N7486_004311 [Penicillium sp. IBT 16267x]
MSSQTRSSTPGPYPTTKPKGTSPAIEIASPSPKLLDLGLLKDVSKFNSVDMSSVCKPDLIFRVAYNDGSSGIVRCGPWIHGCTESVQELFTLHIKVCLAKEMVNWPYLGKKFGLKKENMLRLSWPKAQEVPCSN